jgi:hypothetical protein
MLVQPGMERKRSPLVSIPPRRRGFSRHRCDHRATPQHGCVAPEPASVSPGEIVVTPPRPLVPTSGWLFTRPEPLLQLCEYAILCFRFANSMSLRGLRGAAISSDLKPASRARLRTEQVVFRETDVIHLRPPDRGPSSGAAADATAYSLVPAPTLNYPPGGRSLVRWITSTLSVDRGLIGPLRPNLRQHAVDRRENRRGILELNKMPGIRDKLVVSARG